MKKLFRLFSPHIESGVRLIAATTSIRWFGWGFVEAFIPIFLFSFAETYAETGFLRSIYGIVFLISLPVVSWLADRIPSKKLILTALLIYPFISLSYFSSGLLGIIAFLVLARAMNGVAYALDSVGRGTYVRTHARPDTLAASFGYIDSLANFWWLIAVFISLWLSEFIPVPYLFLFILPTSLIAILFARKLPDGLTATALTPANRQSVLTSYTNFFKIISSWGAKIRALAWLLFFVGIVATVGEFFIPIYIYTQNGSLWQVILLTAFITLPSLLSSPLGIIVDRHRSAVFWASGATAMLLVTLAFVTTFAIQLLIVFCISVGLQILSLSIDREATLLVPKENLGSLSGAFQGVSQLSEIVAPIALGIAIDVLNLPATLFILAFCSIAFALIYFRSARLISS